MPSDPQTFNLFRTDEIMRRAACKAAERAMKILDTAGTAAEDLNSATIRNIGIFIRGCAEAMHWPDDADTGLGDFDD